jgi:type IV pilus assembly protein PilA
MPSSSHAVRRRLATQAGYTFIELLVIILIIGSLAAIALPAFLSQRVKAQDANAKSVAAIAANAMEGNAVETDGYDTTRAEVIGQAPELADGLIWTLDAERARYEVRVTSRSGTWFSIGHHSGDPLERGCSPRGAGGCGDDGSW